MTQNEMLQIAQVLEAVTYLVACALFFLSMTALYSYMIHAELKKLRKLGKALAEKNQLTILDSE